MHIVQVGGMFFGMASLLVLNAPEFFGLSQAKRYKPGKFDVNLNAGNPDGFAMNLVTNLSFHLSGSLSIDGLSPFELVTTGVYSIVRHPIYLAGILMITFQPVVTYNWLTVTVMSDLYFIAAAIKEERALQKLPEVEYCKYMDRVPMFNLLAGIYRRCKM
ncbi:MAG: isoprenylcysteine carboxylmethyltransferase family protein [Nitrospirae bacterium]|nr:isoprenylcysteine carboxylmethyltransferase family protein [Nitrospirota bacterium]